MLHKLLLLSGLIVLLSISACKKKDPIDSDAEKYRPIWEVVEVFGELENTLNSYSEQGYSANASLVAATNDLEADERVSSTYHHDSTYAYIVMANGMEAVYALIPVDGNGDPLYRGGSQSGTSTIAGLSGNCTNEITNKKILLFNAEFNSTMKAQKVLEDQKDKFDLEVEVLKKSECTYEKVLKFGEYGLVVLNTHGIPNGFLLGQSLPVTVQNSISDLDAFAEEINKDPSRSIDDRKLIDNVLGLAAKKHYDPTKPIHEQEYSNADTIALFISAKQVAQLNLSGTIVFGNMCYSGFDNSSYLSGSNIPILEGFRQANTRAYYGYQQNAKISAPVNSGSAEEFEEYLYTGFFKDGDSTGNAHLNSDEDEYHDYLWDAFPNSVIKNFGKLYLRGFFNDSYCYDGCSDTMVDPRDSLVYKTVCIGNQVWMAENLNWAGAGVCYDNDPDNCKTFGRLYSWQEAVGQGSSPGSSVQGVCPKGWHIPSDAEVEELFDSVGGNHVAGEVLKADTLWSGTSSNNDEMGFSALPSGQWNGLDNVFDLIGNRGTFWTSSTVTHLGEEFYRMFYFQSQSSTGRLYGGGNGTDQVYKFACRCIKD